MSGNPTLISRIRDEKLSKNQKQTAAAVSSSVEETTAELIGTLNSCADKMLLGRDHFKKAIAAAYKLVCLLVTEPKGWQNYETSQRKRGRWKTSCKPIPGLLRFELGMERRLASKWAKGILAALEKGVTATKFHSFVEESGGIEKLTRPDRNNARKQSPITLPPENQGGAATSQGAAAASDEPDDLFSVRPGSQQSSPTGDAVQDTPTPCHQGELDLISFIHNKVAQAQLERGKLSVRVNMVIAGDGLLSFREASAPKAILKSDKIDSEQINELLDDVLASFRRRKTKEKRKRAQLKELIADFTY